MMDIFKHVKSFLQDKLRDNDNILLAMSGGADSSLLFDILYKLKDILKFNLHVAHVDHSFRKESADEAAILKNFINEKNIFFHFKKINITDISNIEEKFRNERYVFFKETLKKINSRYLLLAHHKDDLSETVLKRVLEGANLQNIYSMTETANIENYLILRPLLNVSKKDILKYLNSNNLTFFEDRTNKDTYYLRARFREKIIPYIEKNFQKNISDSLYSIASYSNELNDYLSRKLKNHLDNLKSFFLGNFINLNDIQEKIELRFIINKISKNLNLNLSREHLNNIIEAILDKKANFKIIFKNFTINVDRGYLFIINKKTDLSFKDIPLNEGILKEGSLKIDNFLVDIQKTEKKEKNSSWIDLLNGKSTIYVPADKKLKLKNIYNKNLKKRFENHKVPSFLRKLFPVVYVDEAITYDFLSSKNYPDEKNEFFKIFLKILK
jgi:tRNA(Ile)-lysidine synthase